MLYSTSLSKRLVVFAAGRTGTVIVAILSEIFAFGSDRGQAGAPVLGGLHHQA
jgi:hypothetical protein